MTKKLIMLVEDDVLVRTLAKRIITGAGYGVEEYVDGFEAFERLLELRKVNANEHFGLILSDIRMPIMDGIEFANRCLDISVQTPIVLMSGSKREGYPSNVKDFLLKPIRPQEYEQAIKRYGLP